MNNRRATILWGGSAMLAWATGCADPCVDDGLSQEPQPGCPIVTEGGSTDATDPTTTSADGTAEPPGCNNGIQDGDETDVDCGGSCDDRCGTGQGCGSNDDCESDQCGDGMTCEDPFDCADGEMNGDETDLDCGGSCPPCDDGQMCNEPGDCTSMLCDGGVCGPSCSDGAMNGDETDVDCGGSCPPCDDGQMCNEDGDCQSQDCEGDICVDPCSDGEMNGSETDVDCGGPDCDPCADGEDCLENDDCESMICNPKGPICSAPSCNDGVMNGDETDLDCGGPCGPTCEPGQGCIIGGDCVTQGCDGNTCNDFLSVDAAPSCSDFMGMPVGLTATAMGGSGVYTYAWTPDDGTLSAPDQAITDANPASFQSYTVTVDDGFTTAQDSLVILDSSPFDLQNNCTLYNADFNVSLSGLPASIEYDMMGTRACEIGNNEFGLHLCETVSFENTRLIGTLAVTDDPADDNDWMGLVWGAQSNSSFYSLTWKQEFQAGTDFLPPLTCDPPGGIIVRRVDAPDFMSLTANDFYCDELMTPNSTLLLGPADTTTEGWVEGESYTVTIDFTDIGSDITVTRDSDMVDIATFVVIDNTYTSGFFGSTTASQQGACAGPLFAECI
ncbi:MAG: hypothetical protein AAGF11_01920 [Myxococcota bacterium]